MIHAAFSSDEHLVAYQKRVQGGSNFIYAGAQSVEIEGWAKVFPPAQTGAQ
jgi:hypothetical protein